MQQAPAYRDNQLGIQARRDELRDLRRTELAVMPIALTHVFSQRVARAATGAAALACSCAIVIALSSSTLFEAAIWLVPGLNIMLMAAMTVGVLLGVHIVATWVAQWVFERRMRHVIVATDDLHADLDRLARGPIEIGRRLVRTADGWAIGLTLVGVVSLVTVFGFLAFAVAGYHTTPSAWTEPESLTGIPIAGNIGVIAGVLAIGVLGACVVGYACDAEHRRGARSPVAQLFEHRATGVGGLAFAIGVLYYGGRALRIKIAGGDLPAADLPPALIAAGATSIFLMTAWVLLWRRRREHARIYETVATG